MNEAKRNLKIVFMGTPEFAIPSLDILLKNGYDIVGVITSVDKIGGRGRKQVLQSAIKKYAQEHGLTILQPRNLKSAKFHRHLQKLNADLQVVVAFRMLPEVVWAMPPLGTINLHGSLLPRYRGAAPINWAIINGESKTGLTTFFIQQQIDTGDLLFQEEVVIEPTDTAGDLHDKMKLVGAELVLKTVTAIASEDYVSFKQVHDEATKAPKIFHEMCEIDFNLPGKQVYDFIRGLSPWPGAWTVLDGQSLKIYRCLLSQDNILDPGQIQVLDGDFRIGTKDVDLIVEELQLQGRKRMTIRDFLNGYSPKTDYLGLSER